MMDAVYPARSKQVAARMLGGEMMIMSAQNASLFNLNDVGSLIWNAADGRTSLDEIIARLCAEFDVTPEVARHDAETFIHELAEHGILLLNEQPVPETK
ncbi:MAG: PqqD family protein [Bryobacteraceae bacterium]|jgi:coenzyme PQQ synthesis protein D (PqqD)